MRHAIHNVVSTRHVCVLAALFSLSLLSPEASATLIFSEIMYNPASTEDDWEWIELYNGGASSVDLTGYVVDDINTIAQGASNIGGGSIAPGKTGVLYNADDISAADFSAAWGSGINLIPVTGWGNMQLNNGGDTIGLWDSFASYSGDNQTHANVVAGVSYDDSSPWPSDDGASSIYLADVSVDSSDGSNWRLSTDGVDGATTSNAAGGNLGADVASPGVVPSVDLVLTGIIDGPLTGGLPKAIELYALGDIGDLSAYSLESANNGSPSTNPNEFVFPTDSASSGEFLYIATETTGFNNFFGFSPDYIGTVASINGDDAFLLFKNGVIVDVFGVVGVDGTGQPWEYQDGWAYRVDGTGPDGDTFVLANWMFSGINALDGESTNSSAATPFPIGTYAAQVSVPEPTTLALIAAGLAGVGFARRRNSP